MEVFDHRQRQADLHDERDGDQFVDVEYGAQEEAEGLRDPVEGDARPDGDGLGNEAEFDAELSDARLHKNVAVFGGYLAQSGGVGAGGFLQQGHG